MLLVGIVLMLMSGSLLSEGMFLDGVTYACISRNMAEGQGTFWNPFYTQTIGTVFHSHPPLAFGLEALAFKALGDHLFVERFYSLLAFVASAILVAAIWKRSTNRLSSAWLPLLLWVSMPLVLWGVTNNMLENTMAVFVLLSVYLLLLSYQNNSKLWLFAAGVALFMAFMSKGFTGLFPLVFPLVYCIFDEKRHWVQGLIDMLLLILELAVLSGVMFLVFPQSLPYLIEYIQIQVLGTGLHEATVATRFSIVFSWLGQVVVPIVLVAIVFIVNKFVSKKQVKVFEFPPDRKWFLVFLIFGLTGVLPIMVSMKQSDFYMLAALPFFALALGHFALSKMNVILLEVNDKTRNWMMVGSSTVLLLGVVLNGFQIGKYNRDEALIKEVKQRMAEVGDNGMIEISPEEYTQWAKHAYYMRYGKISLSPTQQLND